MTGPQFLVYFWHPDWLPDLLCSAVLQIWCRLQLRQLGRAKSEKSLYSSLVRPSHLSIIKQSNSVFWHFANIPSSFRAVVGISLASSIWSVVCVLGGLNSHFQGFLHIKRLQHVGMFPHLKIPMVQLIFRKRIDSLHGTLSGHKQIRQRKLHHLLDRLKTLVQWGSQIACKNEFCMFINCDLMLLHYQHCPKLLWDGLKWFTLMEKANTYTDTPHRELQNDLD